MKCLSLFSGIGGFDLALQNLGHEIIGACEIDKYARSVYARHFPEVPIYNDATTLQPESLPQFDLLCGGFPCQAFSVAGKRRGFDDCRGTLFFEIARIAKAKKPRYLFLENVRGLLNHNQGETFRTILSALDEMGYDAEWQVINGKYFLPQNRERIFIVGHLRGQRSRQIFPLGDCDKVNHDSRSETQGEGKRISGMIDSNYWKGGSRTMIVEPEIKYHNMSDSQYKRVYDENGICPTLGVGHAMNSPNILVEDVKIKSLGSFPFVFERRKTEPDQKQICNYLKKNKTQTLSELSEKTGIKKTQIEHYFRDDSSGALPDKEDWLKLKSTMKFDNTFDSIMTEYVEDYMTHEMTTRVHDSSGLSPTLTGGEKLIAIPVLTPDRIEKRQNGRRFKEDGDPSFTLTAQDKHGIFDGKRIRRLTPLECERLQGFPDGWTEGLSDTQRYKCLGNAVMVSNVEYIAKHFPITELMDC